MKKIENKTLSIIVKGSEERLKYSDLIINMIQTPDNKQSFTSSEMVNFFRVAKLIDKKSDEIILEDADFEFVLNKVKNAEWEAPTHIELAEFVNYILNLK